MNKRFFCPLALIGISLPLVGAHAAPSDELSLYGVKLQNANVRDFVAAAKAAGARPAGSSGGLPTFDVRATHIPDLASFRLLSSGGQVVTVQFTFSERPNENETLRKMLVSKYGDPDAHGAGGGSFTDEYLADGTYVWSFAGGMKLIYDKQFFDSESRLTYSDEARFDALMNKAKKASDDDAAARAKQKANNF